MYRISSAGTMPSQNSTRQAVSGANSVYTAQNATAAMPQPTAQLLCTRPTALPRCRAWIISAISTEPTDHSPPKPRPCSERVIRSCSYECVKPLKKVNARPYILFQSVTNNRSKECLKVVNVLPDPLPQHTF